MELFRTFSNLDGTELKRNGTSYFVNIGTCNGTSYNFVPLERNLTSYIWNGTFITTGTGGGTVVPYLNFSVQLKP